MAGDEKVVCSTSSVPVWVFICHNINVVSEHSDHSMKKGLMVGPILVIGDFGDTQG